MSNERHFIRLGGSGALTWSRKASVSPYLRISAARVGRISEKFGISDFCEYLSRETKFG